MIFLNKKGRGEDKLKGMILAAGMGTRLKHLTENLPKGMVNVHGKSLVGRITEKMKRNGIGDVIIIGGYKHEKIDILGTKKYVNTEFADTNMVFSMFCAEKEFDEGLIVSYGDILFKDRVLQELEKYNGDIVVVADKNWGDYWVRRYGSINEDSESFVIDKDNCLVFLGKENPPEEEMDARYVGLIKFSKKGLEVAKKIFEEEKAKDNGGPWRYSKSLRKGYMTDFLQAIVDSGQKVDVMLIDRGWLEFDTVEDYELNLELMKEDNFD